MKRIKILGTTKEFEEFVNRSDIEIKQVDVKGLEQNPRFQQGFMAVVYYSEKPSLKQRIKNYFAIR